MRAYGPRAGRQRVPQATALGSQRLETGWWVLHTVALAIVLSGIFLASRAIVASGTQLLLVAVLGYLANIARVMAHLFWPQTPAMGGSPRSALASS